MRTAFGFELNYVNRHQRGGKAAVVRCNARELACTGELEERKGAARGHVQGERWQDDRVGREEVGAEG